MERVKALDYLYISPDLAGYRWALLNAALWG